MRHPLVLFVIAAAILISGASMIFVLPALADVIPHDPSSCGGG